MRFALRSSLLASLVLGVVCLQPLAAHAQNAYITVNTTLNASNPVTSDAYIGYANASDRVNGRNPTSPTVNLVSGGRVGNNLYAYNSSVVNVSGGSVDGGLAARNSSTINFSGGSVSGGLNPDDSSTINFTGGSVDGILEADGGGTINLFGTGLTDVLITNAFNGGPYSLYNLSGTLSDGTVLLDKPLIVQNGTGAKFTLNNVAVTPEPGSVALLAGLATTGAGFLSRRRRK